jgi:hypothetical protein
MSTMSRSLADLRELAPDKLAVDVLAGDCG